MTAVLILHVYELFGGVRVKTFIENSRDHVWVLFKDYNQFRFQLKILILVSKHYLLTWTKQ